MKLQKFFLVLACLPLAFCACSCRCREASPDDEPYDRVYGFAGNCTPYHSANRTDTPAPRGYKPFYISHYGRHGSRIFLDYEAISPIIGMLGEGERDGTLNPMGRELLDSLRSEWNSLSGLLGQITERGAREHKLIARRMYLRFPEVFARGGDVYCISSDRQRCLASMANFTSELKGRAPESEFHFHTGPAFQPKIIKEDINPVIKATHAEDSEAEFNSMMDCSSVISRFFTVCPDITPEQASTACKTLFVAWFTCASADRPFIDILKYISDDELKALHVRYNDWFYVNHCRAADETGPLRVSYADEALENIIRCADAAVGGNLRAADLRFGHDSGLSPLLSLMSVKNFDRAYAVGEAYRDGWNISDQIPMAANLQIVFYRSRRSPVILVKLLLNEGEISLPALNPVSGPYYDWAEVREYWLGNIREAEQMTRLLHSST